jgi:glycosyltransferase EpsE
MPRLSIIIGAFNSYETIACTIDSIKAQTYKDWECVICDDGSKDDTWDILKDITKDDNRFILIRNEKNLGLGATLNRCIEHAKGEYLARQDADDVSLPERLTKQVVFLDSNPRISVAGTYAELFDKKGKIWGVLKPPLAPELTDWIKGSCVIHPSTLMRRRDIVEAGLYNPEAIRLEDYDLWLRMAKKGYRIVTMPEILYRYHLGLSDYKRKKLKHRWNETKLIYHAFKDTDISLPCYVYLLKPIFNGIIPSVLLHMYHRYRFRRKKIENVSGVFDDRRDLSC